VPTSTQRDTDAQSVFLSTIRESQGAVIDVLRAWTDISQQLTRNFRLPVAAVDLVGVVDRAFDVAEQSLAAQREVARTLVGVVTRQADTAVDTTVEAVTATVTETADRVQGELEAAKAEAPKAEAPKAEAPKAEPAKDQRPNGRRNLPYEERSIEELRERARELDIEGRSSMSKDELIAALRKRTR
jgi:Rho termination factor, N-terminal domain